MRANNEDICAAADEQPAVGGNLAKMGELQGDQNPKGFEYSVFEYQSDSAEELVALLLY